jgi:hypothetical protein
MLESQLIETKLHPINDAGEVVGILIINANGALDVSDFERLTKKVDTYLEKHTHLHAALIHAEEFPGWVSFASLISHLKFVRLHHQKIEKIALVTDTVLADAAEVFLSHFIKAELKHFPYCAYAQALEWTKHQ